MMFSSDMVDCPVYSLLSSTWNFLCWMIEPEKEPKPELDNNKSKTLSIKCVLKLEEKSSFVISYNEKSNG